MSHAKTQTLFVIAEHAEGRVRPVTYETLSFARAVSEATGKPIRVVVLDDIPGPPAREIAARTGHKTHALKTPGFAGYHPEAYRHALKGFLAEREDTPLILAPHTSTGWDFAPALAIDLGGVCISTVCAFRYEQGLLSLTRQVYYGKLLEELRVEDGRTTVVTVLPGTGSGEMPQANDPGPVSESTAALPEHRIRKLTRIAGSTGTRNLRDAETVIAVGRGVGKPENLQPLHELTGLFHKAALGASRPLCDAGWLPYDHQIGMTGQTVSPRLYIACGISGAVQHTMGIGRPDMIVAVNTDRDAPFCRLAHCSVIEDLQTFLPVLIEEIRTLQES